MDALDALVRGPVFRGIDRADLEPLLPRLRRRSYPKGAYVWMEGDPGDVVDVVIEGRVKTSRVSADGVELVIQYESPGSICGLPAALIDGATRMTQGEAVEDSVLISLDRQAFLSVMEAQPVVMRRVLELVAATARATLGTLSGVGFLDLRARVAQKLLDLAELYGEQTGEGTRIGLHISQRSLAGMVAASREKVNRALAALAADGLIRQEAGSISILAPEQLRARAQPGASTGSPPDA